MLLANMLARAPADLSGTCGSAAAGGALSVFDERSTRMSLPEVFTEPLAYLQAGSAAFGAPPPEAMQAEVVAEVKGEPYVRNDGAEADTAEARAAHGVQNNGRAAQAVQEEEEHSSSEERRAEALEAARARRAFVHAEDTRRGKMLDEKQQRELQELSAKARETLSAVRKTIRELVQEGMTEEGQKKLAGETTKLLDLLRSLRPEKNFEALEKGATRALASAARSVSKAGTQDVVQPGAAQDKGVLSLVRLARLLPGKQEVTALASQTGAQGIDAHPGKKQALKKALAGGEESGAALRDAREAFRLAVEVRDQRINDPRSLREAVRVARREGVSAQQAGLTEVRDKPAQAEPNPVSAADAKAFPPVTAPKSGQQSSLFMQHDFGARETGAGKKVQAGESLKNPQQVMREIVEHARVTVKSGMTEMHLTLNPRSMGRIGMHFSLGADGELSAKLVASNEAVRQYLQENLSTFSRDLADAGVNLAHLEVAADGARRHFMDGHAFEGEAAGESAEGRSAGGLSDGAADGSVFQERQHDGLLDVRA
jgi:hypothetical protein